MKCPVCEKKNMVSKVFPQGGSVTAMNCQPHYDEAGVYHSHDKNIRKSLYTCSKGHRWVISATGKCPSCDFGKGSEEVKILKDTESELILNTYG